MITEISRNFGSRAKVLRAVPGLLLGGEHEHCLTFLSACFHAGGSMKGVLLPPTGGEGEGPLPVLLSAVGLASSRQMPTKSGDPLPSPGGWQPS